MSPPERPAISQQMAVAHPLLGNLRSATPKPWELDVAFAPEELGGVVGGNAAGAFDSAVGSAAAPGTVAPPTTPVGSDDGARGGDRVAPPRGPGESAATAAAAPATRGSRLLGPATSADFYGQAFVVGHGHLHFKTSSRMEDWRKRLQALSLERQEEGDSVLAAAQGGHVGDEGTALSVNESARVGDKRSAPTDDDDEEEEAARNQSAAKRSRLGAVFQRTISRAARHRADGTTTTMTSAAAPLALAPGLAGPTVPLTASNVAAIDVAAPKPGPRPFSPVGSPLSRVSGTGASAGAASSVVASRTIKICLVGDVAAGKTAFFNRLVDNSFVSTSPSLAPDYKAITVRAHDDSVVSVELWDFPGIVAGERPGPLLSTFFHAAIICFSLEDKANLSNIAEVWKPKLDASLHDQHIFVLGLKRDLRPAHPMLGLSFLPTTEPVSTEMGQQAAQAIHAGGYGECSALTLDNVQGAVMGIVNHVVATLEEHEHTIGRGRRLQRARSAVSGFLNRMRLRRFGEGRR
ncbi:P-loop containing nucleoside triphosphate hydrolase protein [Parathielavia appendiculata]|uniref:P-loop containing nucleoside triphosphate hydrolase protein n=1 Tax=Parathielavia appendiculata TaxID=2587402 RepID=A0AAN6Z2P7_9PEZI|nr:P-loop containing nucleoside triphosphate hydrolase protein [Parathielavia appendiculata]